MMQRIPAFGEECTIHDENKNTQVVTIQRATEALFSQYGKWLTGNGFVRREMRSTDDRHYAAYCREGDGVFLNYYGRTAELVIVMETDCAYFSYTDRLSDQRVSPQITQLHLEDFGMSYVVRLSDGRFLVLDGGRELEPDAERLMACLKVSAGEKKPVIAAWIMTHPHPDHYYCFFPFMERFGESVEIQRFMLNFPEADDLIHYPKLVSRQRQEEGHRSNEHILRLWQTIKELEAEVYIPHTGQRYSIGDAKLDILSSLDDTIGRSDNINASSLVIRMELSGQVILWATDASFEAARLAERYGGDLKADILQVPHHGFGIGSPRDTIAGYRLIAPEVCLLPVSDYNAFTTFCAYRECTEYLMTQCGVKEMITGERTQTLTLPYYPDPNGKKRLREQYISGHDNAGARTWVFAGLNTSRPEDFEFTILNMTYVAAEVHIELFFEDGAGIIRFIKATVLPNRLRKLCIVDGDEVERNSEYYNPWSIDKKGIPENSPFAVRFMSKIPVVISHREHRDTYHTSVYHLS